MPTHTRPERIRRLEFANRCAPELRISGDVVVGLNLLQLDLRRLGAVECQQQPVRLPPGHDDRPARLAALPGHPPGGDDHVQGVVRLPAAEIFDRLQSKLAAAGLLEAASADRAACERGIELVRARARKLADIVPQLLFEWITSVAGSADAVFVAGNGQLFRYENDTPGADVAWH